MSVADFQFSVLHGQPNRLLTSVLGGGSWRESTLMGLLDWLVLPERYLLKAGRLLDGGFVEKHL